MSHHPPEGLYPTVLPSPEALRKAAGTGEIFQAMCMKCDEYHNLIVDLGSLRGVIPREETALGIAQGKAREIAILSRVGKPLCFQVLGFTSEGTALLSRRSAQEEARDYLMESVPTGQILPAAYKMWPALGSSVTLAVVSLHCSLLNAVRFPESAIAASDFPQGSSYMWLSGKRTRKPDRLL